MGAGLVFDIQHFCLDDGPGIRTTVFFKGCPLRCIWCHNAEGLSIKPQIYFSNEKCAGCGMCAEVCPQNGHSFYDNTHKVDFFACLTVCLLSLTIPNMPSRFGNNPSQDFGIIW